MRLPPLLSATALVVAATACTADPPEAVDDTPDAADTSDDAGTPPPLHDEVDRFDATTVSIETDEGDVIVSARVAATPAERQRGLMHVPDLPDGAGMLFLFEEEHTGGFWMKDTLVPLDIAFADAGGSIVAILAMDPCEADPCDVYDPGTTYTTALEVPQGWFDAEGVTTGDELRWTEPEPAG